MREVSFLSAAADFCMEWRSLIFEVSIGTSISICLILFPSNTCSLQALMDFVYFPPRSDIEQIQVRATKMLATWSVLSLLVLCPMYYHGTNYMKCGKLWLRGTIAYVSDDHIIEYGTAIAACCYVAFVAVSLQRFEHSIPKFNQTPAVSQMCHLWLSGCPFLHS